MDFVVIEKVVVKIHHVVLEFDRPVIPQGIFGADAQQQSAGRVVKVTDIDMRPGGTHLAVDEPLIDEPAEPPSERGYPVDIAARRRQLSFNTEHPTPDLVIEPDLAAANKIGVAVRAGIRPSADMSAGVEAGPIIVLNRRRPIGRRTGRIGRLGRDWHRDQRRRNKATLQELVHTDFTPDLRVAYQRHGATRSWRVCARDALYLQTSAYLRMVLRERNFAAVSSCAVAARSNAHATTGTRRHDLEGRTRDARRVAQHRRRVLIGRQRRLEAEQIAAASIAFVAPR